MSKTHHPAGAGLFRSRAGWVLIGFLLIGAFFIWTEHRAHAFGVLPYLLLLACPLMHLFMHHGHGGHRHHDGADDRSRTGTGSAGRP